MCNGVAVLKCSGSVVVDHVQSNYCIVMYIFLGRVRWSKDEFAALYKEWTTQMGKPSKDTLDKLVAVLPKRNLLNIRAQCFNLLKKSRG